MLTVKRNKANIFRIGKVVFYPGITEIHNKADIEMVQAHKSYKGLIKSGVMEEVTKKAATKSTTSGSGSSTNDITKMNASDAIDVIRTTFAIPILQEMHQRETDKPNSRKTVLQAILDQIEEIKSPPADNDDDDNDDDE